MAAYSDHERERWGRIVERANYLERRIRNRDDETRSGRDRAELSALRWMLDELDGLEQIRLALGFERPVAVGAVVSWAKRVGGPLLDDAQRELDRMRGAAPFDLAESAARIRAEAIEAFGGDREAAERAISFARIVRRGGRLLLELSADLPPDHPAFERRKRGKPEGTPGKGGKP